MDHPCIHEEKTSASFRQSRASGSPPRGREKGIIPRTFRLSAKIPPCTRQGNVLLPLFFFPTPGITPVIRGKYQLPLTSCVASRLIPAQQGKYISGYQHLSGRGVPNHIRRSLKRIELDGLLQTKNAKPLLSGIDPLNEETAFPILCEPVTAMKRYFAAVWRLQLLTKGPVLCGPGKGEFPALARCRDAHFSACRLQKFMVKRNMMAGGGTFAGKYRNLFSHCP